MLYRYIDGPTITGQEADNYTLGKCKDGSVTEGKAGGGIVQGMEQGVEQNWEHGVEQKQEQEQEKGRSRRRGWRIPGIERGRGYPGSWTRPLPGSPASPCCRPATCSYSYSYMQLQSRFPMLQACNMQLDICNKGRTGVGLVA